MFGYFPGDNKAFEKKILYHLDVSQNNRIKRVLYFPNNPQISILIN